MVVLSILLTGCGNSGKTAGHDANNTGGESNTSELSVVVGPEPDTHIGNGAYMMVKWERNSVKILFF